MRSLFPSFHYSFQDFVCLFVCLLVVVTLFSHTYGFNWQILSILEVSLLCPHNLNDPNFVYYQKYYSNQPLYTLYIIQQGDMRQDSMTSRYKPSYSHGIAAIASPILSGLHTGPVVGEQGVRGSKSEQNITTSVPPSVFFHSVFSSLPKETHKVG